MTKHEQIRQSIKDLGKQVGPLNTMLAQVTSVDEDALTCELVTADEVEVYDVRLCPVLNGNQSIILFPSVNSWVLAVRIEKNEDWMVINADQVDKFRITSGSQVFEMDGTKFLIKNGTEDLKTLMDALFDTILAMSFTTNMGVTIQLVNAADFETLKTRFESILKSS